jgi:hypothetical protein
MFVGCLFVISEDQLAREGQNRGRVAYSAPVGFLLFGFAFS